MQALASLVRKILARLEYFLQDSFYWGNLRNYGQITKPDIRKTTVTHNKTIEIKQINSYREKLKTKA